MNSWVRRLSYGATAFIAISLTLFLSAAALAQTKNFQLSTDTRGSFDIPNGWKDVKDYLGVPLVIVGPEGKGARPVVTVAATGARDVSLVSAQPWKGADAYRIARLSWLEKASGKLISFFPYLEKKWANSGEVHEFGYQFTIGKVSFTERTYYVNCKNQIFHINSLVELQKENQFSGPLKKIVESFNCE